MMRFTKLTIASILGLSLLASCSDDDSSNTEDKKDSDDKMDMMSNLELDITGLKALGADFVYEGWLIVEGQMAPVSTGRFTDPMLKSQSVSSELLKSAMAYVLTLEPANETGDALTAPADSKLFRADFDENTATISYKTIGSDYSDLTTAEFSGNAFLRTPTDDADGVAKNDEAGIWFGTPGMPPVADLELPDLTEVSGWTYEGWIVIDGKPYSTGTFNNPKAADDNAATSQFKGSVNNGPGIPGEDFIQNLMGTGFEGGADLRGGTAVISIEPVPDDSPAPFVLKPLLGAIGQDTAPAKYPLNENFDSFPTGTITR